MPPTPTGTRVEGGDKRAKYRPSTKDPAFRPPPRDVAILRLYVPHRQTPCSPFAPSRLGFRAPYVEKDLLCRAGAALGTCASIESTGGRVMLNTVWAVIREGKIEPLEPLDLPEVTKVLVTPLLEEDRSRFWRDASQSSLAEVWDNPEDDVYAELLEK
jgi:hypothetical protein